MQGRLWTVRTAEPMRRNYGWGAEEEVLSPPALRQALAEGAARGTNVRDDRGGPLAGPGHGTHCGHAAVPARPQCSCVVLLEYEGIGRARLRDNLFG